MMIRKILPLFILLISTIGYSADFYWIGGSGNWSDVAHWSNTSGGASAGAVPGATDNAFFDDNSGLTGIGQTVTMDVAVVVTDYDYSNVTNAFTIASALPSIEIQGHFRANGLANITWTGDINLNASVVGNEFESNGTTWSNDIFIIGSSAISFVDDFNSTVTVTVNDGGLIAQNIVFHCFDFISNVPAVRNIDFNNATINLSGSNWDLDPTSLTSDFSGSVLSLLNIGTVDFNGGDQAYNEVISSANTLNISGDNSFSLLELSTSSNCNLGNGSIQQLDSLVTTGDCTAKTILTTINSGANASLEKTGYGVLGSLLLDIVNVDALISGGQSYNIALSDTTNSSNWTFVGSNFYWIGDGGNWSDPNHWSLNSGGIPAGCIPGSEDSVYFDANSFSIPGQTVTVDVVSSFGYMNWSGLGQSCTLNIDENLTARGDVILNAELFVTRPSNLELFTVERTSSLTSDGALFDVNISLYMIDDNHSFDLNDDLSMTDSTGLYIISGQFNSNSNNISAATIQIIELPTLDNKGMMLGSSFVDLEGSFNAENVTANFTFDSGTSHFFVGSQTKLNSFTCEGLTFHDVTLDFYTADFDQRLSGSNTYNRFEVLKGSSIVIDSTSVHSVNDSLLMIGNCNERISISSTNPAIQAFFSKIGTSDVILECLDVEGVANAGSAQAANYSNDLGNNSNWGFSLATPVTSSFTADGPYCFGDTTQFTNLSTAISGNPNDITSYWYFDDGSTGYWYYSSPIDSSWISYELDTNEHVFISGGDFDVMLVTEYTNFCKDTSIVSIYINKPTILMVTSEIDKTICQGESVTFEASSFTAGVEFEFFLNGASQNYPSVNDTLYVTSTLSDQDTISVLAYENGCVSDTMPSYIFTVNDTPVFNWLSSDVDTSICFGDQVDFSTTGDPSYTYRFLLNNAAQTAYIQPGNYSNSSLANNDLVGVVAQNIDGCTDTLEMIFEVIDLPLTSLTESTGGNVICDGETVTFTASGASTYEFFIDGISQGPPGSDTYVNSSLNSNEVITVVGYSVEGCLQTAPESYFYTVNPLPNVVMTVSDSDTSICSNEPISFEASGAAVYEFFVNGISQGTAAPTTTFSPLPGTLSDNDVIYVEGSFSGCSNQSSSATVEVFTSPTTTLTSSDADQIICSEDIVTFDANGANNYEFFINGTSQGPASPVNTFIPTDILNGDEILVEGSSNGCIVSQSLTFTVLPVPSVGLFSDDPDNELCEGEVLTLTGSNAQSYELFVNSVSQGAAQSSPTFTPNLPVGTNNVYLIGTSVNGCTDTSFNVLSIQINPSPSTLVSSSDIDNMICDGEEVVFTSSGADQFQFFLDGIPQGSLSSNDTYTSSNLTNGQTIQVLGSSLGCTATSNTIITSVTDVPSVELTSTDIDNVFCEGDIVDFNASGANNYEFFIDGVSQGPSSPTSQINSFGFGSGSYLIEVIGEDTGCADTTELNVTVNALPTAGLTSSDVDNVICSGESITYTASGGSLYEFFVNGVSSGSQSPVNTFITSTLSDGDIISVNATSSLGCSDTDNMPVVTVNPTPNAILTSSDIDLAICAGENVDFTALGGSTYEFFVDGVSQGVSGVNTFSSSTLSDGTTIYCEVVDNSCSAASAPLTFTVYQYPTIGLTNAGDTILCDGELTAITSFGGTNYQFYINGTPFGTMSPNDNLSTALNDGDYITVSGEVNGCESVSIDTIYYSVIPYPTLSVNINPGTTICHDDQVAILTAGADQYEFSFNGNIVQQGSSNLYLPQDIESGDQISITASNHNCETAPSDYTFTVNEINLNLTANPGNLICEGESVSFTASGADNYEFFLNGVSQGTLSPTNTFTSGNLNHDDVITVSALDLGSGCTQDLNDQLTMSVIATPVIDPTPTATFCEGDSLILYSNSEFGNQWIVDGIPVLGANDTSFVMYTSGDVSLDVTAGGDGDIWSFGQNNFGVLGNNTNTDELDPVPVASDQSIVFDQITSGYHFVLGKTNSGEIYSWGDNEFGQLGDGTYTDALIPTLMNGIPAVKTMAATESSAMAITTGGEIYVWGNNSSGQLGTGNFAVINFPMLNSSISSVDTIAGGKDHFILLLQDGTVWSVGNNDFGQLGNNSLISSNTPVQVSGLTGITRIGAGDFHSFAIDNNGDVYAWGNNSDGQLGLGDQVSRLIPTQVNARHIIQVDGGSRHSLLLNNDGEVYSTGSNTFGQLGTGVSYDTLVPSKIEVVSCTAVSAGPFTSLTLRSDNTVLGFGLNDSGQLSQLTSPNNVIPERISSLVGVTAIDASDLSSHFILGVSNSCGTSLTTVSELTNPQPTISGDADTLTASAGTTYQWYYFGNPIPGATNQVYVAQNSGQYTVEVGYGNGCSNTSTVFYHSMTSVSSVLGFDITLYPNPATKNVTIALEGINVINIEIAIMDQFGRLIKRMQRVVVDNRVLIPVEHLEDGVYYVSVIVNDHHFNSKFIKQD
jgi:alpha-tubulin suppressor-like RCC1 family protein